MIEHAGPWGRDGLLDARLPHGLGRELRALERRTGARVLLIRKPHRVPEYDDGTVASFAVDTGDAWLGLAALATIEDALELDPRDRSTFTATPEPLFVVCTHGRRDPCCAERGRPVVERLSASFPEVTWESTHVGGDRFAGNLVAFPHGLYHGRVEPERDPRSRAGIARGGSLDSTAIAVGRAIRPTSRRPSSRSATASASIASTR